MSPPLIDPQTFAELQANAGEDFVVELVDTFAGEAPQMLAELREAHAAGAADAFRRAAHSLKSNSNTFGASRLAELARGLELGGMPAGTGPIDGLAEELLRSIEALRQMARGAAGG
jgi:HPt (histidine-containing phosphotransfer) domain-containing protein